MRGRGGRAEEIGDALLAQAHPMVTWGHRVRAGTLHRSPCRSDMTPLRREVEQCLEVGRRCGVPKTDGTCRDILTRREALWTCVQVDGVQPTKNAVERSLRPGVLWRTGSLGTQRAEGSGVVERMRTVVTTLQQPQRHVLAYLPEACEAALRGEAAPSLLPASDQQAQSAA